MTHSSRTVRRHQTPWLAGALAAVLALVASAVLAGQVPAETAFRDAALEFMTRVALEDPVADGWSDGTIGVPETVYDADGRLAWYRFPVLVDGERRAVIVVAADTEMGASVLAIEFGGVLPGPAGFAERATETLFQIDPGADITGSWLVACGGVETCEALAFRDGATGEDRVAVFDRTGAQIESDAAGTGLELLSDEERSAREAAWEIERQIAEASLEALRVRGIEAAMAGNAPLNQSVWAVARDVITRATEERWKTVDLWRCHLYVQQKDFCARATLQMIDHFYHGAALYSQNQIDAMLNGWGWKNDWFNAFSRYLTSKTGLKNPAFTTVPSGAAPGAYWLTMGFEIEADRPFVTYRTFSSTAHVTMAMGTLESRKHPQGGAVLGDPFLERWLGEYDPAGYVVARKIWNGSVRVDGSFTGFVTAAP